MVYINLIKGGDEWFCCLVFVKFDIRERVML